MWVLSYASLWSTLANWASLQGLEMWPRGEPGVEEGNLSVPNTNSNLIVTLWKGRLQRMMRESKPTRWERNEQACPSLLSREIVTLQFLWFSFCCRIRNKSLTKATRGRNSYSSSQLQVPGHQTEEDTAHLKAKRNQCIHAGCFVLPMSR